MKKILVMAALSLMGLVAQAQDDSRPVWVCGLAFEGQSKGVQILLGRFRTEATGELRCTDAIGGTYVRPIRISMRSSFLSPTVGIGQFAIHGVSGQISLFNQNPEVLFGHYLVARGQAALVGGVAAFTAVRVSPPEVAMQLSLQVVTGFGVHVGIERMLIEPLD